MSDTAASRRREILLETVRKLLLRGAQANVSNLLRRVRPVDVAGLMHQLDASEQLALFRLLRKDYPDAAGEVLTEMATPHRHALLASLAPEEIAAVLGLLPVDDAVFVVDALPESLREEVVSLVDLRDLRDVQTHLAYRADTAGRIMDPDFFSLPEGVTVREAIAAIQEQADVEIVYYLYVVDDEGHLVGVTSLRQLLLSAPDKRLAEIMTRALIKVHVDTDQEEVAQLAARYNLLAIPVTDDGNHLVGIVTVDDIVDVVKEEATEDLLRMAGTSEEELLYERHPLRIARYRLPALLVATVLLLATGLLLARFQAGLVELLSLLAFVPVIRGLGGAIGAQTSTVAVRRLVSGRYADGDRGVGAFVLGQAGVGAILGAGCALLLGALAALLERSPLFGLVVGLALFLALTVAAVLGALLPPLLRRLGVDPVVASGPLLGAATDISGILIYFGLATWLAGHLAGGGR